MYKQSLELAQRIVIGELFLNRKTLVVLFCLISLSLLVFGLFWPKNYTSYTTVYVEQKNIIKPLLEGAAVTTDVADRSKIVREAIYSRSMLKTLLKETGQLQNGISKEELEKQLERVKKKIDITKPGKNLIRIQYKDDDPKMAFKAVKKVADLFINEGLSSQVKESKQAFEFINKEVDNYHEKLRTAEEELKVFRTSTLDARPGTEAQIGDRLNTIQKRIENTTQDLREAEITKESIEKQLSGEAAVSESLSREQEYRTRIQELQSQLETLRLDYKEGYPDIVRIKHQIEDLKAAIVDQEKARKSGKTANKDDASAQTVFMNPLYQKLRQELSNTKTNIETLRSRLANNKQLLEEELTRGKRVHTGEAKLAELTRDYEVNRDIYRDLLKRRERARVSMNMDASQQGLTMKIYEPAFLPTVPSGLRFLHFAIGGLVLGIAIPLGLVFMIYRMDPRVRSERLISENMGLPVLGVVPHYATPTEEASVSTEIQQLSLITLGTLVIIAITAGLRFTGII